MIELNYSKDYFCNRFLPKSYKEIKNINIIESLLHSHHSSSKMEVYYDHQKENGEIYRYFFIEYKLIEYNNWWSSDYRIHSKFFVNIELGLFFEFTKEITESRTLIVKNKLIN